MAVGGTRIDGPALRDALVDRYASARRFAAVVADADLEPDDLVQEAFARVFRRVRRGGLDLDSLDAYLRQTLFHLVANERRTRARGRSAMARVRPEDLVDEHYPSDVAALLDAVAPIDRALVFLVDAEGLPTAAAGDAVGLSPDATRARLSRARRTLRAAIEREEES